MTEIHSDWGDWLPTAIADADPNGLALWYLGCNGFALKSSGGTTLFIDPYLGTGDPPRTVRMIPVPFEPDDVVDADALFVTHEHSDHVDGPSQGPLLAETGATMIGPDTSLDVVEANGWRDTWEIGSDQLETVDVWDSFEVGDLTVTVGPANDPDADEPVSYVIDHPAGTVVHGGDARPGEFAPLAGEFDLDLGILALGSTGMIPDKETREPKRTTWYNDERMVVEAANELELDRLLPTHWDMWKGLTTDPAGLHDHVRSFEYPNRLDIVEIGDRVDLRP